MSSLRPLVGVLLTAASLTLAVAAHAQSWISVSDITVGELSGGIVQTAQFTLRLTDSTRSLNLQVSTATPSTGTVATPGVAGGTCSGQADYLPLVNVPVSLNAATPVRPVIVSICGDAFDEDNESFLIRIVQANGSPISDNEARATITDDDATPTLQVNDVIVDEGAAGSTRQATFNISLSAPSGRQVSVTFATGDSPSGRRPTAGTCGSGGADFVAVAPVSVNIPPFSPATNRSVTVCGDGVYESAEHLAVFLTNAVNASPSDGMGILTIADDEPLPDVALSSSVPIGATMPPSATSKEARFTVTMTGPPIERPFRFSYSTENGTATSGSGCLDVNLPASRVVARDYIAKAATDSLMPAGATTKPIPVTICTLKAASGETFRLRLTSSDGRITQASATATIP